MNIKTTIVAAMLAIAGLLGSMETAQAADEPISAPPPAPIFTQPAQPAGRPARTRHGLFSRLRAKRAAGGRTLLGR